MYAELVMIGSELLLGEIVDTNATRLAQMLRDIGLELCYKTTVGDNEERIREVLNIALDRSDIVITSGGLGPTVDDVTRQAVAEATGHKLVFNPELETLIAARFQKFGRKMTENNRRQAYIPEGALPLPNPVGTAPCFLSEDVQGRGFVISLPGVPRELEYMMRKKVIPVLTERMGGARVLKTKILRTCAVGESNIDGAIGDLMSSDNPVIALAAHAGQTDIRITAKATTQSEAEALIAPLEKEIRKRLGIAIYGEGKERVPEVVGRLLMEQGLNLGLVDGLTGGEVSMELVEAGFGRLLSTDLVYPTLEQIGKAIGLTQLPTNWSELDMNSFALMVAQKVTPPGGIGLALLGPSPANEPDLIFMALHGPNEIQLSKIGRRYQDVHYSHRWVIIQGLDWVRRVALDQLTSPVD